MEAILISADWRAARRCDRILREANGKSTTTGSRIATLTVYAECQNWMANTGVNI
jgi:hypothetical protein